MLILCKYVTLRSNPLLSSSSAHVCGARHYTLPSSPLTLLPPTPRSALSPSLLSRRDGHAAAQPRRAGDRRRAPPRRLLRGGARLRAGRLPELPGLPEEKYHITRTAYQVQNLAIQINLFILVLAICIAVCLLNRLYCVAHMLPKIHWPN